MTNRSSPGSGRISLRERGLRDIAEYQRREAEGIAENLQTGRQELRRSFVFRFYHDTMLDTGKSGAYHKVGPDSPDPDIRPVYPLHSLGGGHHNVPWEWRYDGIKWRAVYDYRHEGWNLDFYVRGKHRDWWWRLLGRREWRIVHSPGQVVEVTS